jgi:hypothetical protein
MGSLSVSLTDYDPLGRATIALIRQRLGPYVNSKLTAHVDQRVQCDEPAHEPQSFPAA